MAAEVAQIFNASQQSVASHRRNVLKLRSLQEKSPDAAAFHQCIAELVTRVLPVAGNAVAVGRVIDFVTLMCSQVDGMHSDSVGVHIIKVRFAALPCRFT